MYTQMCNVLKLIMIIITIMIIIIIIIIRFFSKISLTDECTVTQTPG